MLHEQIAADLHRLQNQLASLREDMNGAITDGKNFIEVKMIHMQIKELSRLIERLKTGAIQNSASDSGYFMNE